MDMLKRTDAAIADLITKEDTRLTNTLNLIASENYAPLAVREATGSLLTNKYAEGYPKRRYYAGCQWVDEIETLAIDRVKKLFGAEHANVQPHSGSQANAAAYFAVLKPGDTVLAMSLPSGGHLTHGHPINFSGQFYTFVNYNVDKDSHKIDYEAVRKLAKEHKPKLIVAGASAYSRFINFSKFREIADEVGALLMVDMAHIAGLVAAHLHPSPVPYADIVTSTTHKTLRGPRGGIILCKKGLAASVDRAVMPGIQGGPFMNVIAAKAVCFKLAMEPEFVEYQKQIVRNAKTMADQFILLGYDLVSGQSDNHLFILDLRSKNLTGKEAEEALTAVGIYTNRNTVPFDTQSPFITSGIRIGTPMITSRGMKEDTCKTIAILIDRAIKNRDNKQELDKLRSEVSMLCQQFPFS